MKQIFPDPTWILKNSRYSIEVPMQVPGDFISALHSEGIIADPFYADHETDLQWIGRTNWLMETSFFIDSVIGDTLLLSLEQVDTIAEVYVNGQLAGSCENMFFRHTFDITDLAREGDNRLEMLFYSPEKEAEQLSHTLPYPIPHMIYPVQSMHRNLLRKTQCHAGWDWGPCLMTGGIYTPPVIHHIDEPFIQQLHCTVSRESDQWLIEAVLEIYSPIRTSSNLELRIADAHFTSSLDISSGHQELKRIITVRNVELWWPAGYGDQPLYELSVRLGNHAVSRTLGFRTIEVNTQPDEHGIPMTFVVNGVPIFCKGANWIPIDALPGNMSEGKYIQLLEDAHAANMNMIRVWGGGMYESEIFYSTCDRLGLLVWQDFMFACSLYPAQPWFLQNVRQEVEYQIKRLKDHPCLALWCGNNEDVGALTWFEESIENRDRYLVDYDRLNEGVIGTTVARLDPERQWWSSSPSAGPGDYSDCWHNDSKGDMHYWSVWHEGKPFEAYREVTPRFCSEFGFQAFPSRTDIDAFCPEDQLNITSPVMESHQRNDRGNTIIISTISRYFRFPSSFDHILYLSQVQQAMAITTAVSFWRSRRPVCMGTLFWQLNDTWPGPSWSSIAYSGDWKLLHYAAQRFYAPQMLSLIPADDHSVEVYGINDTQKHLEGELVVTAVSFSGECTVVHRSIQSIGPACSQQLAVIDVSTYTNGGHMLNASFLSLRQNLLLATPKACELHTPDITVDETAEGNLVLSSDVPALFVKLEIEGWEGRFSDNGFHLLNGERKTVAAMKGNLPPDWRTRLSILNLRDTY